MNPWLLKLWTFKKKCVEFSVSLLIFSMWIPFFAKRSFWEEWGVSDSGDPYMNGGMQWVPATFREAITTHHLTTANILLNVGLLVFYSFVGVFILEGLSRFFGRLKALLRGLKLFK